jgi:hypothetical protein
LKIESEFSRISAQRVLPALHAWEFFSVKDWKKRFFQQNHNFSPGSFLGKAEVAGVVSVSLSYLLVPHELFGVR